MSVREKSLDRFSQNLVQLGDLGGNGQVDTVTTDLDNQTAQDLRVDLVGDLQGLAGADELGAGDGLV